MARCRPLCHARRRLRRCHVAVGTRASRLAVDARLPRYPTDARVATASTTTGHDESHVRRAENRGSTPTASGATSIVNLIAGRAITSISVSLPARTSCGRRVRPVSARPADDHRQRLAWSNRNRRCDRRSLATLVRSLTGTHHRTGRRSISTAGTDHRHVDFGDPAGHDERSVRGEVLGLGCRRRHPGLVCQHARDCECRHHQGDDGTGSVA